MNRIPTLDGWRGVAILLVLAAHLQMGLLHHYYGNYPWADVGQHGVTIFFVLSGYLITSRLLEEEKIDLKSFYLRRFFRLMPCAWSFMLALALASVLFGIPLIGHDALACIFFFRNYFPTTETPFNMRTGHFWSLSLEEQFYLLWPPALAFLGRRRALVLAIAGCLGCAALKLGAHSYCMRFPQALHSEVRFDAPLAGCLFALVLRSGAPREWFQRNGHWLFWLCVPIFAWQLATYSSMVSFFESATIACMIAATTLAPISLVGRALEWKHLKFLGVLSYSLYVWQQGMLFLPVYPYLGVVFLPLVAILSYGCIEQPGIALGRRIADRLNAPLCLVQSSHGD
jgi:peptidoglycan/LPS O-acetylase OafA/YrhL